MIVLVTGFESNARGLNASEVLIKSLEEYLTPQLLKYQNSLRFSIIPGNTNILGDIFDELVECYSPDICVFTGQAPGRNKITLERIATNIKNFKKPDRAGNLSLGEKIIADGEAAYFSTLPKLENLVAILEENNIPAAISNYAGNHLCNQILYQALHFSQVHNSAIESGFVHIPILPEQVIRGSSYLKDASELPFMSLEMSRKALSLILVNLLA